MKNIDANLKQAEATFELKTGYPLKPEALRKAVEEAGFSARDIYITAQGLLQNENGRLSFQPTDSDQSFSLVDDQKLSALKSKGIQEVELTAKVIGDRSPLSLEIQEYQKQPSAPDSP